MSSLPTSPARTPAERLADFEAMYAGGRVPFDYDLRAVEALRNEYVARMASGLGAERVLDLGCGLGDISARLAGRCAFLASMDLSPTAAARARERLAAGVSPPALLAGSALELPLRAAAFDLVIASDGLVSWHLDEAQRAQALGQIFQVVRPGGYVLLTEYLRGHQHAAFAAEVAAGGFVLERVSAIHDRAWYWFESWIRAVRSWPPARALRGSRALAGALIGAGRLLGRRGARHVCVLARRPD